MFYAVTGNTVGAVILFLVCTFLPIHDSHLHCLGIGICVSIARNNSSGHCSSSSSSYDSCMLCLPLPLPPAVRKLIIQQTTLLPLTLLLNLLLLHIMQLNHQFLTKHDLYLASYPGSFTGYEATSIPSSRHISCLLTTALK